MDIFDPPAPPKPPAPPAPTPMPDLMDPQVLAEKQRVLNSAMARSGRAATVLSGATGGGGDRLGVA